MAVTVIELGEVITAGNDYTLTLTLTKDGAVYDVTGATVTCTIRDSKGEAKVSDHAVSLTTPGSGIVTLELTDDDTTALTQLGQRQATEAETHYADLKVVESDGSVTHCGPFSFPVRRPIT